VPGADDLQEVAPPDVSFPPRLRLRTRREYREHRGRSRTFRTPHFIVAWATGTQPDSRLGMAVSKKVGNSPKRSRVKRVLREWFRHHRHDLLAPLDLVLIARPGAPELGLVDVESELGVFVAWFNRRQDREEG
jgi:ribonuclease P protein component